MFVLMVAYAMSMMRFPARKGLMNFAVLLNLFPGMLAMIAVYFTQFCCGGVLVSIPISVLFFIMQKFYVEGVTSGAVKG